MSEDRFVRQYALVGKRARSKASDFPLDTLVQAVHSGPHAWSPGLRAEHIDLLHLCTDSPISIAEIGAHLHVYLGVARVLVGDLIDMGLLATSDLSNDDTPDLNSLERLLHDLKAL
jgi:hypothetical protein